MNIAGIEASLLDIIIFFCDFLLVIGLIFEVSGFGAFILGILVVSS
jgi:hypothetical protein